MYGFSTEKASVLSLMKAYRILRRNPVSHGVQVGRRARAWVRRTRRTKTGSIVKEIDNNGNRITNFPGMAENKACHVRPHARDSKDTFELPVRDKLTNVTEYTKHCFWLNNKYLEEILKEFV